MYRVINHIILIFYLTLGQITSFSKGAKSKVLIFKKYFIQALILSNNYFYDT